MCALGTWVAAVTVMLVFGGNFATSHRFNLLLLGFVHALAAGTLVCDSKDLIKKKPRTQIGAHHTGWGSKSGYPGCVAVACKPVAMRSYRKTCIMLSYNSLQKNPPPRPPPQYYISICRGKRLGRSPSWFTSPQRSSSSSSFWDITSCTGFGPSRCGRGRFEHSF